MKETASNPVLKNLGFTSKIRPFHLNKNGKDTETNDIKDIPNPLDKVKAGLSSKDDTPVPLTAVHIRAKLLDLAAQVIVKFSNIHMNVYFQISVHFLIQYMYNNGKFNWYWKHEAIF